MKALEEKILREGQVLPGDILKVGSFLNQQLDCDFLMEMGREIARLYADAGVNKILTVEASGIAIAVAVGAVMHLPVVFAKKYRTGNVSGETYSALVHSYTHGNDYNMVIAKDYLHAEDTVLIVDDFLARGAAVEGLMEVAAQAGATVAGAAIAIEKGFQQGGDKLPLAKDALDALTLVESMSDDSLEFRPQ